eukprot:3370190-Rhodomonas_salina.1
MICSRKANDGDEWEEREGKCKYREMLIGWTHLTKKGGSARAVLASDTASKDICRSPATCALGIVCKNTSNHRQSLEVWVYQRCDVDRQYDKWRILTRLIQSDVPLHLFMIARSSNFGGEKRYTASCTGKKLAIVCGSAKRITGTGNHLLADLDCHVFAD